MPDYSTQSCPRPSANFSVTIEKELLKHVQSVLHYTQHFTAPLYISSGVVYNVSDSITFFLIVILVLQKYLPYAVFGMSTVLNIMCKRERL